jgi:hypothetical protein
MRRKPTETVQVNLRIKESERRKLAAAAERNGVSLNAEMAARLARTFRQGEEREANQLAENVNRFLSPLLANVHELTKLGDLIRAADDLIALIRPDDPAAHAPLEKYREVKHMIEIEAGRRLGKMNTQP